MHRQIDLVVSSIVQVSHFMRPLEAATARDAMSFLHVPAASETTHSASPVRMFRRWTNMGQACIQINSWIFEQDSKEIKGQRRRVVLLCLSLHCPAADASAVVSCALGGVPYAVLVTVLICLVVRYSYEYNLTT